MTMCAVGLSKEVEDDGPGVAAFGPKRLARGLPLRGPLPLAALLEELADALGQRGEKTALLLEEWPFIELRLLYRV